MQYVAADSSLLQKGSDELSVAELKEVNSTLRYLKATADAYIKVNHIDPDKLILVPYGDASWANAPGGKSQGGLLIAATDDSALKGEAPASLLEWKSHRIQRVVRSTLAAEASSADTASDHATFIGCMLSEMFYADYKATDNGGKSRVPVHPVTDCRSLYDAVHKLATNFTEKRVQIDVESLKQTTRNLRWTPTEYMIADGLTKRDSKLRNFLRQWMMAPEVTLMASDVPTE